MAVGKNKRLTKGRKGGKKKIVDPFQKKEWYKVRFEKFRSWPCFIRKSTKNQKNATRCVLGNSL